MKVQITTAPGIAGEAIELERENVRAFLERDIARLDELWSDELIVNSPLNTVHDKRRVLALLESGVIAHHTYDADIDAVRDLGDLLVVMGADRITFKPDTPVVHRRFTNVWRREHGAWKMFARQASIIAAPQAGAAEGVK